MMDGGARCGQARRSGRKRCAPLLATNGMSERSRRKGMGHMGAGAPQGPQPLPGVAHVVAVGSGKGGVGKTTVAVNLAVALAKLGYKTGLVDADIYGPNVPTMLGATRQPNVVGENRIEPILAHGVKFISIGLISPGDKPLVMRGPMLHQIIQQFLRQ